MQLWNAHTKNGFALSKLPTNAHPITSSQALHQLKVVWHFKALLFELLHLKQKCLLSHCCNYTSLLISDTSKFSMSDHPDHCLADVFLNDSQDAWSLL
eukprot:989856-Pelagomonas_calceolata.AAC.6